MRIRIQYSKIQLEECVRFVATHNMFFRLQEDYIRKSIRDNMMAMVKAFPHCTYMSTMGYHIQCSIEAEEGMDEDINILRFEFYVDPSLSTEPDFISEDLIVLAEGFTT